jgi:hypothetical protein
MRAKTLLHGLVPLTLLCAACGSDITDGQSSTGGTSGAGDGGHPSTGGQDTQTGGQAIGGTESGGSSSGGSELGGSDSGGTDSGGTGGTSDSCGLQSTEAMLPTAARSATFSGTDAEYSELYNQLCVTAADCVAPCTERGGTAEFCAAHMCVDSADDYCLPPTKWRSVDYALEESESNLEAAESSLDAGTVGFQDRLILEGFGFDIPAEATIFGVTALVRRSYESTEPVVDYSVRLVRDGQEVGTDLKSDDAWPDMLEEAEYGGEAELWGEEWSPEQVNSAGFGLAIGALPLTGGRAYVDVAWLTVHYEVCE